MPPVDPDRWRVLSPYLDEALDLTSDEDRATWLRSLAAHDAALAADLRSLLDEHHAVHESGFLEGAIPPAFRPASTSTLAGQVVGSYRLVSLIGEGGMAASGWRSAATAVSKGGPRSSF